MTTSNESTGTFARAFLPGLVLGLIIGGVAGAMLPELMQSRPPAPTTEQIEASRNAHRDEGHTDRDAMPELEAEEVPDAEAPTDTPEQPADQPAEQPGG